MSSNRIGEKGGFFLFEVLKHNSTLMKLVLRNNDIKDQAGRLMAEQIQHNSALIFVDLDLNDIDYKQLAEIQQKVAENQNMYYNAPANRLKITIKGLKVSSIRFI